MKRVPDNAPLIVDLQRGTSSVNDWFREVGNRTRVYSGAADPTASEIPENQWILYYNTTSLELRIWSNIAGVALKSAAFT